MSDDYEDSVDEEGYGTDYADMDDRLPLETLSDRARYGEHLREGDTDTEYDSFDLDGVPVPSQSMMGTDLSRFEPKQTIGAYDKDSDATQSAWIQDNWSGGQLINKHIGGATDQRFRSACAWTMNSEQLALPPRVQRSIVTGGDPAATYTAAATVIAPEDVPEIWNVSTPLGFMRGAFWYAIGNRIFVAIADPFTYSDHSVFYANNSAVVPDLDFPPVNTGAIYGPPMSSSADPLYRERLWVPLGINGLQSITDEGEVTAVTAHQAIAVKVWDRRLFILTSEGYLIDFLQYDADTTGTYSAENEDRRLPKNQSPIDLALFYDGSGTETLFIISDQQMWAYDSELDRIVPTNLELNKMQSNGWGFISWRDDAIYVSSGINVSRYSRDMVKSSMGLDRDSGFDLTEISDQYVNRTVISGGKWSTTYGTKRMELLPRAPYIAHMASSLNFLIAFVGRGSYWNGSRWESRMSMEVFNEAGWHTIMDRVFYSTEAPLLPGQVIVEDEVGAYRIWFGLIKAGVNITDYMFDNPGGTADAYAGDVAIYNIAIPRSEHGPMQQVIANVGRFEERGYLKTGWWTANMEGFDKTWSHFEMTLAQPEGETELFGNVNVFYRTKEAPTEWNYLGTADKFGRNIMPFNVVTGPDGKLFSRGLSGVGIEFKYELLGTEPLARQSPIIESTVLKYIKVPLPGRAWQVTVPLENRNENGWGPQEMDDFLARKTHEGGFFPMVHHGVHRVRVAQHQMQEGVGRNPYKQAQLNLVSVEIPGWEPDDG